MKKWMTVITWICLAALAILVQPLITVFDFPLNLTVVLVYVFAIKAPPLQSASTSFTDVKTEIRGSAFGAGIGLIEDVMSGSVLGLNVLSKGLTGFISSIVFRDIFFQWTPIIGGAVIFALTLIDGLILILTGHFITGTPVRSLEVAEMLLVQALLNIPLGFIIRPGQKVVATKYV
jgi:cell shape-determining protein MreD